MRDETTIMLGRMNFVSTCAPVVSSSSCLYLLTVLATDSAMPDMEKITKPVHL